MGFPIENFPVFRPPVTIKDPVPIDNFPPFDDPTIIYVPGVNKNQQYYVTLRRIVRRGFRPTDLVNVAKKPKRVRIRQISGPQRKLVLPLGPLEIQYDGLGLDYVKIKRPNDKALLEPTTVKSRSISFNVILADVPTGGRYPIQGTLDLIEKMASENIDCLFVYGIKAVPFRVRITKVTYQSIRRDLEGRITQAGLSLQLEERPTRDVSVVSLDAIAYEPPVDDEAADPPSDDGGGGDDPPPNNPPEDEEDDYEPPDPPDPGYNTAAEATGSAPQ